MIFCNRRIEDAARTKLLLHALSDVEDATLFLGGDILTPKERVRIAAKLLLERLVDRFAQGYWRSALARNHSFWGDLRLSRKDEHRCCFRVGIGSRLRLFGSLGDLTLVLLLDREQRQLFHVFNIEQMQPEPLIWIVSSHLGEFFRASV